MSRAPLLAAVTLALPLLAGCSAQELSDRASGIAGAAAESASVAARDAVTAQICELAGDPQLSEQDQQTLSHLADAARSAGVESDLLGAVEDVADTDGTPPASDLADLAEACRAA